MNDSELLRYAEIHSQTQMHLFAGAHIKQLCAMAGWSCDVQDNGFYGLDYDTVSKIKEIVNEKANQDK